LAIQDRVCIGSFSDKRIRRIQQAFEDAVCTSPGPAGVLKLKSAALGVPVRKFREGCVQVPAQARGVTLVDRRFVLAAERYGLQVHVWTVDEPAEMNRLLDLGVHGLMTDRPRALKEVLTARRLWN